MRDNDGVAPSLSTARCWRAVSCVLLVGLLAALPTIAAAADTPGKRQASRRQQGYGFLPGYRPPEQIQLERSFQPRGPSYWYGGPGFYRGRWNGGGFGPCWTHTPIGPMWNCG
jgi:hypothetical protein